jgi:hypothetical protein
MSTNNPTNKPDAPNTAAESLDEDTKTSLHEQVFGSDPDGFVNDTPRGAIGANVNIIGSAVELDRHQPLRHIGDSDQGDFQPGGGRRR